MCVTFMHMHLCAYGCLKLMLWVFLCHLPSYWGRVYQLNPELINAAILACHFPLVIPFLFSRGLELQASHHAHPAFLKLYFIIIFVGSRDKNSVFHTCTANSITTKPPLSPLGLFDMKYSYASLTDLELDWIKLTLNFKWSFCLLLLRAGIIGMLHQAQQKFVIIYLELFLRVVINRIVEAG